MSLLKDFVTSYIPNFLENKPLPQQWLSWLATLRKTSIYEAYVFVANDVEEFTRKIEHELLYLTADDLKTLYEMTKSNDLVYFAAPPLCVDHSIRLMLIKKKSNDHNKFFLNNTGLVEREPESYTDNKLHGECAKYITYSFSAKALDYARTHWPNLLQIQPPLRKRTHVFSDPSKDDGFCGAREVFHLNTLFDDSDKIVIVTHDKILTDELCSGGAIYSANPICIYDGSFLGQESCSICHKRFKKDFLSMYENGAISKRLYDYVITHEKNIRDIFGISDDVQVVPDISLLNLRKCEAFFRYSPSG